MRHIRVAERAHHVEDAVRRLDVAEELVAEASTLRRALDQTSNVEVEPVAADVVQNCLEAGVVCFWFFSG